MAQHNNLGQQGEQVAADFLAERGYRILHRNWRCGHKELDIVECKENLLVIVEVKTRRNRLFAAPEESIPGWKIRRMVASADAYVRKYGIDMPIRFDLITLIGETPPFTIEHIEEAFYPPVWN